MNKTNRYRLTAKEEASLLEMRAKADKSRVLVIGDVHLPFERKDYLQFCIDTYKEYQCNRVVFIGDIIDSHYSSFHATDPDGLGGGAELDLCVERVKDWYKAFPDAEVCIGNHDAIIMRKAFDSGVPKIWIKEFNDVLKTPNWQWVTDTYMVSTVTGHFHTDFYIDYMFGKTRAIFAMAVGCGIDDSQYAFAYAAGGKKNAIGCAVVLNGGETPILVKMNLEKYKD